LPSILGGIVSLIFREGSFGMTTGRVDDEGVETGGRIVLLVPALEV
jgi:hypothetical protein